MNAAENALHHQRLAIRAARLRAGTERLETELAGDPVGDRLARELAEAESSQQVLAARIRERDREVEAHRARLRARQRELMSGRTRNPTDLMKMSSEVDHMRVALGEEEDRELELMEEQERLEAEAARLRRDLESARTRAAEAAPGARARLALDRAALAEAEAELDRVWAVIPSDWRTAYERVASRIPNPIAEVVSRQCQTCGVTVTSSGMQEVRRHGLVLCDNCGRILVMV